MRQVHFICLGNSCRSQMAEAFARQHAQGRVEVSSAGVRPAGFVHPLTKAVMEEVGVSLDGVAPKPIDVEFLKKVDWIVFLSPEVRRAVPIFSSPAQVIEWKVEDPVLVFGKEDRKKWAFRQTRDQIDKLTKTLIEAITNKG